MQAGSMPDGPMYVNVHNASHIPYMEQNERLAAEYSAVNVTSAHMRSHRTDAV